MERIVLSEQRVVDAFVRLLRAELRVDSAYHMQYGDWRRKYDYPPPAPLEPYVAEALSERQVALEAYQVMRKEWLAQHRRQLESETA